MWSLHVLQGFFLQINPEFQEFSFPLLEACSPRHMSVSDVYTVIVEKGGTKTTSYLIPTLWLLKTGGHEDNAFPVSRSPKPPEPSWAPRTSPKHCVLRHPGDQTSALQWQQWWQQHVEGGEGGEQLWWGTSRLYKWGGQLRPNHPVRRHPQGQRDHQGGCQGVSVG